MKTSVMDRAVGRVQKAADRAVGRIMDLSGVPTDPDLRLYDSISTPEFDALMDEFGPEQLTEYVRQMEVRRMSNGTR